MTEMPFVDTHFHLHDMKNPRLRYTWLERDAIHPLLGDIDAIKAQHYWVDDYIAEIRFSNVPKAIHVQAALGIPDPVEETRWLQAFADKHGYPHGIVAECHLRQPDAEAVLERHLQFANVRGVRDLVDGEVLADPSWERGFSLLGKADLSCCIDTTHEHFPKIERLAQRCPNTAIFVDHCGYPLDKSAEYFEVWRAAVHALARTRNVYMKISGLGMFDPRWTVESIRPWVLACIDSFGPARVVFGTNWPLDRLYSSYPDLIKAYRTLVAGFSPSEQAAMLCGNAERLFRI